MFKHSCIALLALSACNNTDAPTTPAGVVVPDGWVDLDPSGDEDGDGLLNGEETSGYEITVNRTGVPGEVERIWVISDPTNADPDGDGLLDGEERTSRTDPFLWDTDGDGLSDEEEIRFWGTSPVAVDSDGDAVGTDGQFRAPNPRLFDGAELQLDRSVTEVQGSPVPGEPGPRATSPRLVDTDADGADDFEETLLSGRSPVIAEVVDVSLRPTASSSIEIGLIGSRTDGSGSVSSFTTALDFEEEISTTIGTERTLTSTYSLEAWAFTEVTESVGCCADIFSLEVSAGFGSQSSLNLEQGFTLSFEAGLSLDTQTTLAEADTEVSSQAVELSGGILRLAVDLENNGSRTVRVADIALIVRVLDPVTRNLRTLGELVPVASQTEVLLAPGEVTTIQVENLDLPLDPMRQILADPRGLAIHIARYDLRDQEGQDFDFVFADLPDRTAAVTLERVGAVERHYVATDVFTDVNGHRYGTTLAHMLTALGKQFDVRENADGDIALSIDGIDSQLHVGEPPDLTEGGADPHGYPVTGGPGARSLRRGWIGLRAAQEEAERDVFYTDFFAARMRPADTITLLLSEDLDQDGVPAIEERLFGSSDLRIHSDARPGFPVGDGLSDFWEIREGWVIEPSEFLPFRVFSGPGQLDSDGDGLMDNEEQSFDGTGTDPLRIDTDADGFDDFAESNDDTGVLDPLVPDPATPPELSCTYVQSQSCSRTFTVSVRDAVGDVDLLTLDPGDGTPWVDLPVVASPGETQTASVSYHHCFAGHGSLEGGVVYATDRLGSASAAACFREVVP